MFTYNDMPFCINPESLQYNKEKMDEHASEMVKQYNINKRIHFQNQ